MSILTLLNPDSSENLPFPTKVYKADSSFMCSLSLESWQITRLRKSYAKRLDLWAFWRPRGSCLSIHLYYVILKCAINVYLHVLYDYTCINFSYTHNYHVIIVPTISKHSFLPQVVNTHLLMVGILPTVGIRSRNKAHGKQGLSLPLCGSQSNREAILVNLLMSR